MPHGLLIRWWPPARSDCNVGPQPSLQQKPYWVLVGTISKHAKLGWERWPVPTLAEQLSMQRTPECFPDWSSAECLRRLGEATSAASSARELQNGAKKAGGTLGWRGAPLAAPARVPDRRGPAAERPHELGETAPAPPSTGGCT